MYHVYYSPSAIKTIKKLDRQTARIIKAWIDEHLENSINPRKKGKALHGALKGHWRYRVGDYRIIATIEDKNLLIYIFEIGHRKDIYK